MHAVPHLRPDRAIHVVPGAGAAAHVLQGSALEALRVHVAQNALISVERGIKTVRPAHGAPVQAHPGDMLIVAGNQTVDFINAVPDGEQYEARWLVFDDALLNDAGYRSKAALQDASGAVPLRAIKVPRAHEQFARAVTSAAAALDPDLHVPGPIACQRMLETLYWLLEQGIILYPGSTSQAVSARVRAMVGAHPDRAWTGADFSSALAISEATLRRRLAGEGTSLTMLLGDVRMATALTLLQATNRPVADIALAVGYASPSRFAVRFRQRFDFSPSAVRGNANGYILPT